MESMHSTEARPTEHRDPGQLPIALDAHQSMIDELTEELSLLRQLLAPVTQDVETVERGAVLADPSPPVSELTRRVRYMTDQLRTVRDTIVGTRAYLDL